MAQGVHKITEDIFIINLLYGWDLQNNLFNY